MAHIYVEQTLVAHGYLEVLKMLPTREMDEQPLDWLERCDEKMSSWLMTGKADRDLAERAIGCAENLAAELQRIPAMVGWSHREYIVAVNNRLDPSDNSKRYQLASECELPGDGEDDFIERTLLGLLA